MSLPSPTWPLALAGALLTGCSPAPAPAPAPTTEPSAVVQPPPELPDPALGPPPPCTDRCEHWHAVLAALDQRRERAYASARPGLLGAVYVAGSAALRRDRAMLLVWSERDVTVTDLRLELLDLDVLSSAGRLVRLRVVDRLVQATARLPDGRTISLPRDSATARVLELRRVQGRWRIASSLPESR